MVTAIVAAAGTGDRLGGDAPKALVALAGKPLVAWPIEALARSARVGRLIVAAPGGYEQALEKVCATVAPELPAAVVTGGAHRSESVANALKLADGSVAVVNDAARPLVTAELVDRCIDWLEQWGCDATVAAARATDTIKEADTGGRVTATLARAALWAVQTPQAFRVDALRTALAGADLARAYDDAQLVEENGGDVRIVEAPRENLKVTTPIDLQIAELMLRAREAAC